ncbi:MAG TPA: KamA family radical SAM protein, partial [Patescibacteria group bacterium]|nr:KamA family radical SAM protein [Patescibacteria group bacterium]
MEEISVQKEDEPPPNICSDIKVSLQIPEWKKILRKSINTPKQISLIFGIPEEEVKVICERYPARITPYYASLIKNSGDAIYKQCVPDSKEITDVFGEEDPLHEEPEHQIRENVPGLLIHRYPDRVLFRISNQCAMYCRFCTRKRKVGDANKNPKWSDIAEALNYIREHEEIRDVILSGGDPLMLDDLILERILREVHAIIRTRENGIIRIGTRIPCVLPQRITPELCEMLKKYHPLYINTHFNHPAEITEESKKACSLLADAGIPLGCQTVLLRGVNDNPETMKKLMQKLVSIRVKPYYIYQTDLVRGTNHFRTKVETGLDIIESLTGNTSGLCLPHFVIDAPCGGGKIPVAKNAILDLNDKEVRLR